MRILLTNDDGVLSPVLYRVADALKHEHAVTISAPAKDQSGMSHGFTHGLEKVLHYRHETHLAYPLYAIEGTPSDCVKFAIAHLLKHDLPDLVVSGLNLGENAGVSAVYSGTVAAAREAALWNIPALAISLMEHSLSHQDFAIDWILGLLRSPENLPLPGSLWNINFPHCTPSEVVGAEFTTMGTAMFEDHYVEVVSEHAIPGYRLMGKKPSQSLVPGSDDSALRRKCIAITPLQISQTHTSELERLKQRPPHFNAYAKNTLYRPEETT